MTISEGVNEKNNTSRGGSDAKHKTMKMIDKIEKVGLSTQRLTTSKKY